MEEKLILPCVFVAKACFGLEFQIRIRTRFCVQTGKDLIPKVLGSQA